MSKVHPAHLVVWIDKVQARIIKIKQLKEAGASRQQIAESVRENYQVLSRISRVCSGSKAYFSGVPHKKPED